MSLHNFVYNKPYIKGKINVLHYDLFSVIYAYVTNYIFATILDCCLCDDGTCSSLYRSRP